MPELSVSTLLLFAAFVVPGAVSMQIYRLKAPSLDRTLQERLLEAVVFSVINFSLLYWAILYALDEQVMRDNPFISYFLLMACLFVAPVIWPFLLAYGLRRMEGWRWIQPRARTGWDHYFNNLRRGSYVIVHLNDGAYVGGRYDRASYASSYPDPGHLFLEETWEVGENGRFTGVVLEGQGVILRPTDYKYVRVST